MEINNINTLVVLLVYFCSFLHTLANSQSVSGLSPALHTLANSQSVSGLSPTLHTLANSQSQSLNGLSPALHTLAKGKRKPPPTPPPPPPPIVTPFEFLKLVERWPKSYCIAETCDPHLSMPLYFTLHGLWPSNKTGTQPNDCDKGNTMNVYIGNVLRTVGLGKSMDKYWPELKDGTTGAKMSFWSTQWNKHGTCSSMNAVDYFQLAIKLIEQKNVKKILENAGITPGGGKTFEISDAVKAIKDNIGFAPEIKCVEDANKKTNLYEVRICLNKKGDGYIDCPGNGKGKVNLIECKNQMVHFP